MSESESPYAPLRTAILDLFYETVSCYPPPHAPGTEPAGAPPYRLGEYLVYQGYLSPRELRQALQESLSSTKPTPLGFILVTRYRVPLRVLTMTLLLQTLDRLMYAPNQQPRFLGEQLLCTSAITPYQLAAVLEEQASLYAQGQWTRIGDLIARRGWLDAATLTTIVREMGEVAPISTERNKDSGANPEADISAILALLTTPPSSVDEHVLLRLPLPEAAIRAA